MAERLNFLNRAKVRLPNKTFLEQRSFFNIRFFSQGTLLNENPNLFNMLNSLIPKRSMYAIYAYIGVVLGVNVSIYGIHGVSGIDTQV